MLEAINIQDSCAHLRHCISTALTPRDAELITLRYGLSGHPPLSQHEVAARFGISRSYVSRLEKKALEKLRVALEGPQ